MPKHWALWFLLLVLYIFSWLPIAVIDYIGDLFGAIAIKKNRKRYSIAKTNIEKCFPEKTALEIERMVEAHFKAQMRSMLHYSMVWWAPMFRLKKFIELDGYEHIDASYKNNKNVIALTCHSVGLEFTGIALSERHLCSGPYKAMRNEVIDWLVARGRSRLGTIAYPRKEGMRPMLRHTRGGRILIYLADEDLGPEHSIFVPFFGVKKATIPLLGRLAKSCNANVHTCGGFYDEKKHKYKIRVFPAIKGYPQGDEYIDTIKMNQAIEQMVLCAPEQFFWTFRLFQTRPDGEDSFYE